MNEKDRFWKRLFLKKFVVSSTKVDLFVFLTIVNDDNSLPIVNDLFKTNKFLVGKPFDQKSLRLEIS